MPGFYSGVLFDAARLLVRAKRMQLIMDGNLTADLTLESPGLRKTLPYLDVFLPNARCHPDRSGRPRTSGTPIGGAGSFGSGEKRGDGRNCLPG